MKQGLTLTQMAQELERQQKTKRDFVADTRKVSFSPDMKVATLANGGPSPIGAFGVNEYANGQLAELLKIPLQFYRRMKDGHPDLLANTLNELLRREPTRRMLRTLDGNVRAIVSDKFRAMDNFDLANAVLPVLMEIPDMKVASTQFTETRFYVKATFPRTQGKLKRGDVVQAGICVSNSEVGAGSLKVEPFTEVLACENGMIHTEYGQKRYHVGKRAAGDSEAAFEMFSDKTKELDDAALWSKVQDTVRGVANPQVFAKLLEKYENASEQAIEGDVVEVVQATASRYGYNEATQSGILSHLIAGGDLSRWGLANAITRQSQDEESYDLATQLEVDGGNVIELPSKDWQSILARPVARAA